jgi:hypothetical protein
MASVEGRSTGRMLSVDVKRLIKAGHLFLSLKGKKQQHRVKSEENEQVQRTQIFVE